MKLALTVDPRAVNLAQQGEAWAGPVLITILLHNGPLLCGFNVCSMTRVLFSKHRRNGPQPTTGNSVHT